MLNVKSFIFNPVCVNTYLVYTESEGVIIDCGCMDTSEWSELKDYIDSHSLRISHLLNTHLHLDPVFGRRAEGRAGSQAPRLGYRCRSQ